MSGSGATLGSGADADAVVDLPGVGAAHLKLEVKQGRVFVTALKDGGRATRPVPGTGCTHALYCDDCADGLAADCGHLEALLEQIRRDVCSECARARA